MITIDFTYEGTNLADLDERLKSAVEEKLGYLTNMLYDKVQENLSGKVLQKVSGQLAGSIRQEIEIGADVSVGSVFPDPATPKAWALEKGGEKAYIIVPTKSNVLKFFMNNDVVFASQVVHPPSREFRYLGEALDEMTEVVPIQFNEAIQAVLNGE